MLAQGQEVFLEKQIADSKKIGLLAKLASQAGYLYTQAIEGTQENVNKAIFEKVWLLVIQVRLPYIHYYDWGVSIAYFPEVVEISQLGKQQSNF